MKEKRKESQKDHSNQDTKIASKVLDDKKEGLKKAIWKKERVRQEIELKKRIISIYAILLQNDR